MKCSDYNLPECWICYNEFNFLPSNHPCLMQIMTDEIKKIQGDKDFVSHIKIVNEVNIPHLLKVVQLHYPQYIDVLNTFLLLK